NPTSRETSLEGGSYTKKVGLNGVLSKDTNHDKANKDLSFLYDSNSNDGNQLKKNLLLYYYIIIIIIILSLLSYYYVIVGY
ncbi:MAG TPA: hypothetical protein PK029_01595, partial [Bacteroidales bacterium]|nr:hypothetical protein [Bacteroidales bacterium]